MRNTMMSFFFMLALVSQTYAHAGTAIKLGECHVSLINKHSECKVDRQDVKITQMWVRIGDNSVKIKGMIKVVFGDGKVKRSSTNDGFFSFHLSRSTALPVRSVELDPYSYRGLEGKTIVELWGMND
jgi:hypothetical protein